MLDVPKATEKSYADGKILQSVSDGVGVITFNNPEKRNAMSLEMWEGLGSALIELRDNPDVRVVILVGAGDKAFVSGADISQFEKTRHNARGFRGIFQTQRGATRAAGELSEADHCLHPRLLPRRRHAGRDADRYPHCRRQQPVRHSRRQDSASPMAMTACKHLVSLVGPSWARLIMYTGMRIDSAEALRIGLVDRVLPDDGVVGRDDGDRAHHFRQRAARDSGRQDHHRAGAEGSRASATWTRSRRSAPPAWTSEDFREGRRAFMEKRKPQFKGR